MYHITDVCRNYCSQTFKGAIYSYFSISLPGKYSKIYEFMWYCIQIYIICLFIWFIMIIQCFFCTKFAIYMYWSRKTTHNQICFSLLLYTSPAVDSNSFLSQILTFIKGGIWQWLTPGFLIFSFPLTHSVCAVFDHIKGNC